MCSDDTQVDCSGVGWGGDGSLWIHILIQQQLKCVLIQSPLSSIGARSEYPPPTRSVTEATASLFTLTPWFQRSTFPTREVVTSTM